MSDLVETIEMYYVDTTFMIKAVKKLPRDLQMEMVTDGTGKFAKKPEERLLHHVNVEAIQPLDSSELARGLKNKKNLLSWCSDH